ncbi:ATP-binding cassette, subfamily B, RaxB [Pseudoxanthomonas sp. GM95]|uniref:peptidase domain-containing ABC transporter n=1 Tax=Pseudoxanthomonas sp. GM95 TaxID=1881043 RepID=UPI0008AC6808|nr:peptidase domain-containing ABC transporter [Pseudoxanthomonas sp. GM95]SEL11362.1 ATP-binding cassette, subfamily B, RaxB [Pseudoxanthomonas sp. GM95]
MINASSFVPWATGSKVEIIMQTEAAECALACIAMIANYHGSKVELRALRRRFSSTLRGMSLDRVMDISGSLNFDCRAIRAELDYLETINNGPAILHWNMNHFVVLAGTKSGKLIIMDPARGERHMSLSEVSKHFTGILLEFSPASSFKRIETREKIPLSQLIGRVSGLKRSLVQVLGLALAIEVLGLCIPLQAQWTIDQYSVPGSAQIVTIASIFIVIVAIQTSLNVARSWLISWIGVNISSQWITNIFGHLMRLPLEFFERRYLGDVLSRFDSIHSIQATLTGSFVTVFLDGITGTLALTMLFVYNRNMALCAIFVAGMYGMSRILMFKMTWKANEERLIYLARQQSELIESVRGIQAIKLAGRHAERRARVANTTVEAGKRDLISQRIQLGFSAASQGIFSLQRVFFLSLGAYLISEADLTAGMLVATLAYADQFSVRVGALIDKLAELRIIRLHLDRISDIVTTEVEEISQHSGIDFDSPPEISITGLGYRYSEWDPWIFRDLSFTIESGQSVAIIGASGCGKTTLAKIILGLIPAKEGDVFIGGLKRNKGAGSLSVGVIAAVMQDDTLFSGTIADNVSFFDPESDVESIKSVARTAGIHDEIALMPMGYETIVGDMGSTLSGGQKQRILLARALYQNPKVLVLDEATSHLDNINERISNAAVDSLNITRIIIAHRLETIAMADRVYDLAKQQWVR